MGADATSSPPHALSRGAAATAGAAARNFLREEAEGFRFMSNANGADNAGAGHGVADRGFTGKDDRVRRTAGNGPMRKRATASTRGSDRSTLSMDDAGS
jgi:hypothetical protein